MKSKLLTSILYTIAGILYIIGPHTIFRVCDTSEHIMKCHWSVQAEIGTGILYILFGVLFLFIEHQQAKIVIFISGIVISLIAILIPLVLIGGCENPMMACRSLTFPAFYLIAALIIIFSTINLVFLYKLQVREGEKLFPFDKKELA